MLGIDLKNNTDFAVLQKLRKKRNKIAHSGKLLGYYSITVELFHDIDDLEKELTSIMHRTSNEFYKIETIKGNKNNPTLKITWRPFDPVKTTTSKEFEENFCSTIIHMWKLGDFLTKKLFINAK